MKYLWVLATVGMLTTSLAHALPGHQRSGSECYRNGHRLYVPDGLNYPRSAWASWGISCKLPKLEGMESAEAAAGGATSADRPPNWCGWWMRQHLGGHFGPEFNTARNWLKVGRPLPGPRPGALGVQEHHVFQVVRVLGPNEVLAISGNDHNAVRTRVRSTAAVIGWREIEPGGESARADAMNGSVKDASRSPAAKFKQPSANIALGAQAGSGKNNDAKPEQASDQNQDTAGGAERKSTSAN